MELEALMDNEEFVARLGLCQSLEEVSALLKANGVEMTEKELQDLIDKAQGELNEGALEDVAGGSLAVRVVAGAVRLGLYLAGQGCRFKPRRN